MPLYDNEENAVVNNAGGTSETPEVLVSEGKNNELSPNPAGFGFTKQLIVDELPQNGAPNTLYLVKVLNDGVLVGYRLYKWTPSDGFALIGPTPNVKLEKGTQEQKAVVNNEPNEVPEKVFVGKVVFNGPIVYKGKQLKEDQGGTEVVANPTLAGTESDLTGLQVGDTKYKVGGAAYYTASDITDLSNDFVLKLKVGDIVAQDGQYTDYAYIVTYNDGEVLVLFSFEGGTAKEVKYRYNGSSWSYYETRYKEIVAISPNSGNTQGRVLTKLEVNGTSYGVAGFVQDVEIRYDTTNQEWEINTDTLPFSDTIVRFVDTDNTSKIYGFATAKYNTSNAKIGLLGFINGKMVNEEKYTYRGWESLNLVDVGGGTKLYRHSLSFYDGNEGITYSVTLFSNEGTTYTSSDFVVGEENFHYDKVVGYGRYGYPPSSFGTAINIACNYGGITLVALLNDGTIETKTIQHSDLTVYDSVVEL